MLNWIIWIIIAILPGVVMHFMGASRRTAASIYLIFAAIVVIGWSIRYSFSSEESGKNSNA